MKLIKFFVFIVLIVLFISCKRDSTPLNPGGYTGSNKDIDQTTGEEHHSSSENNSFEARDLTEVERPQKIKDIMSSRGEQDAANPTLTFVEPKSGATVNNSIVSVKLDLGGDLKGYQPGKDPQTGTGNHIHVILDNQPYEAYYNLDQPFELKNVAAGEHTLRVFPSRPWHESYKNPGAFQMVKFTVANGGANANRTTTNLNQTASNANAAPEGKQMANSAAGAVDMSKPLLTYSRPKGEYKGAEADAIMLDFWLSNAKLVGDGGEYRARYSIDNGEPHYIDNWQPVWISGWTNGKHTVVLELVDRNGNLVENGGYNSTTREITVVR